MRLIINQGKGDIVFYDDEAPEKRGEINCSDVIIESGIGGIESYTIDDRIYRSIGRGNLPFGELVAQIQVNHYGKLSKRLQSWNDIDEEKDSVASGITAEVPIVGRARITNGGGIRFRITHARTHGSWFFVNYQYDFDLDGPGRYHTSKYHPCVFGPWSTIGPIGYRYEYYVGHLVGSLRL